MDVFDAWCKERISKKNKEKEDFGDEEPSKDVGLDLEFLDVNTTMGQPWDHNEVVCYEYLHWMLCMCCIHELRCFWFDPSHIVKLGAQANDMWHIMLELHAARVVLFLEGRICWREYEDLE